MSRPPLRRAEPPWPTAADVAARRAAGWRPYPLDSFVLKMHSRCDLACDYCYMYRARDTGWRRQPRTMAPATVERAAERIAEHLSAHGTREAGVVLHGGEPLLAGDRALAHTVRTLRAATGDGVRLHVSLQTNGVRLTRQRLDLLGELGVRVGVSTDGGRAAHDRHRRGADGRGSHTRVSAALRLLAGEPYRPLFAGLLCTVDLANDPVRTYEELLAYAPPSVDFLLPLGTWHVPPPGLDPTGRRTPYADWLWAVFTRWYGAPVKETQVRLLDDLMALLLGAPVRTESLGLSPVRYAVVETDGSLAQDDALRTAYDGAARTGLDVWHHSFDTLLGHPGIAARQWGADGLCAQCRACPLHPVCGGGHYATRYRRPTGFANPSVYCTDLTALITRVRRRLAADLGGAVAAAPGEPGTARAVGSVPAGRRVGGPQPGGGGGDGGAAVAGGRAAHGGAGVPGGPGAPAGPAGGAAVPGEPGALAGPEGSGGPQTHRTAGSAPATRRVGGTPPSAPGPLGEMGRHAGRDDGPRTTPMSAEVG